MSRLFRVDIGRGNFAACSKSFSFKHLGFIVAGEVTYRNVRASKILNFDMIIVLNLV